MNFLSNFFNNTSEILSKKCKLSSEPFEEINTGSRKNSMTESFKEMQINQTQEPTLSSEKSQTCIQIPQPINRQYGSQQLNSIKSQLKVQQNQNILNYLNYPADNNEIQPLVLNNFLENKSCIPKLNSSQPFNNFEVANKEISQSMILGEELNKQNLSFLLKQFMQLKEPNQPKITEPHSNIYLKNLVMLPYGFCQQSNKNNTSNLQKEKKIGKLTEQQRKVKVDNYLKKKEKRQWKTIKYDVRKNLADQRERCQGRFVKQNKPKFHLMQIQDDN